MNLKQGHTGQAFFTSEEEFEGDIVAHQSSIISEMSPHLDEIDWWEARGMYFVSEKDADKPFPDIVESLRQIPNKFVTDLTVQASI